MYIYVYQMENRTEKSGKDRREGNTSRNQQKKKN